MGIYFAGMPLFQAIQVIKSQDVAIKGVHLCYNEQVPLQLCVFKQFPQYK